MYKEFKDNKITRVVIHTLNGNGNKLFLSCDVLNIQSKDLETENYEEAKKKSKIILVEKLDIITQGIYNYINS